jgi:hypothetical protein
LKYRIITHILLFIFLLISGPSVLHSQNSDGRQIDDVNFRFSFMLPGDWDLKDQKKTRDNDGISYSFEKKDKKMTMMLLAFKLSSVKNIDDFIYNLEKDISLNIPPKSGDYSETDSLRYDMKSAVYKDNKFHENIYYFRTKLPDAPNNYVYMVRFIMNIADANTDSDLQIMNIINTFSPNAE